MSTVIIQVQTISPQDFFVNAVATDEIELISSGLVTFLLVSLNYFLISMGDAITSLAR